MATKVLITTEFPTPDEVAAYHHIPPARVAELRELMEEVRAERNTATIPKTPRNGTRKRAAAKKK
ncbi:MAG TPA: hypothetical protein VGO75_01655 [Gemmatimonadaceae bacterium]|nr:hypothetical protein [Gemmatimonadaceae bacterium]